MQQLKEALAGESASVASSHLLDITRSAAKNAEAEAAAAESLHQFIGSRNGPSNGRSAIAELEAAIYKAANFPRLQVILPSMQQSMSSDSAQSLWTSTTPVAQSVHIQPQQNTSCALAVKRPILP